MVVGLPMAWHVSLSQAHRRSAWMWRLYLPLAITAILLTASRGAVLAALVALVIIPWTLGRLRVRTKAALYALAVGLLLLASNVVPEASLARIASTPADIEAGYFGGRGAIWIAGLEVAGEHPLAGVGAGAYGHDPAASAIPPTTAIDRPAAHPGGRINGPLLGSPKTVLVCPGNASGTGGAANCAENALAGSRGARAPPMNF